VVKYLIPRLRDILFISLLTVVILFGPRTFNLDGDLGRHITIGNYSIENLTVPRTDIFSHTMTGQTLTPHEWLAQVLLALAHRILGLPGVVLLTALIIASTFTTVLYESQARSKAPVISLGITILAAAASSLHWLARPHVFTFIFLAIWSLLLERVRRKKYAPLWVFGLLMLVWANTHGAFIAGFVTWGAYLAGELFEAWKTRQWRSSRLKSWGMIGLISLAATLLNPAGIRLWGTSIGFVSNHYLVSHTQEYLPPDFHNPVTWPFLLLIAFTIWMLGSKKQPLPVANSLLLTGWIILGLYSARNIPLFAIIAAPILSETAANNLASSRWKTIEDNLRKTDQSLRGTTWIIMGILGAVLLMATPAMRIYNRFDATVFPVKASNWLEKHPQEGRVFNYFPWGGYLLYRQWPESLVFIDGQTDFYGESLTREYEQVINVTKDWKAIINKYQIEWAIIPSESSLASALSEDNWEILYQDTTATILREKATP
jgi:MFS family permease